MTRIFKMSNSIQRRENRCNTLHDAFFFFFFFFLSFLMSQLNPRGENRRDTLHDALFYIFFYCPIWIQGEKIYVIHCMTQVLNVPFESRKREQMYCIAWRGFFKCPIRSHWEIITLIHCMTRIFKMSYLNLRRENRCNTLNDAGFKMSHTIPKTNSCLMAGRVTWQHICVTKFLMTNC